MTTIELTDGTTVRTDDPRALRGRTRCFVLTPSDLPSRPRPASHIRGADEKHIRGLRRA